MIHLCLCKVSAFAITQTQNECLTQTQTDLKMRLLESIERINYIHLLINKQSTGSPECFARKLGIRKRQLFNILEGLKLMGAPICYDSARRTYYYSKRYILSVEIRMELLGDRDLNDVNGGSFFGRVQCYCTPSRYICN
jgi:hypothetical protein